MVYVASSNGSTLKSGMRRLSNEKALRVQHVQLALVASDRGQNTAFPALRDPGISQHVAVLTLTPTASVAGPSKRLAHWLRSSAIFLSIGLHAAIGMTLFDWSGNDDQFGTLAEKTDAISLATEQTLVLESIETEAVQTASAASAASQAGSVQSVEAVAQPMEMLEAVEASEPPPKPIDVAEVTPAAVVPTEDPLSVIRGSAPPDEVSETKVIEATETVEEVKPTAVEAREVVDEKETKEAEEKKERKLTAQAASRASAAGSTTSRASAAQAAVSGRVSASRGNVLNYAARIRAVLARNKPGGDGQRGTARISFGVTATGGLSYVRVASSSGRTNLDEAALAAVRRSAPFGPPPVGVASSELKFTIPFYFR